MPPSEAIVRHARREDAKAILDLIQALADYEKESAANEATVATLEATIAFAPSTSTSDEDVSRPVTEPIAPHRPSRCILLFAPGSDEPAGIALYFYNYSTWRAKPGIYLEDLFVQPDHRGKGYGKRLLVELAKQVLAMDGGRLEWSVLKWNEPSIKFYESIGAAAMDEWMGMRVEREGLNILAHLLD